MRGNRHLLLRRILYPQQVVPFVQVLSELFSPLYTNQKVVLAQYAVVQDHADVTISTCLAHFLLWLARLDAFGGVLAAHRRYIDLLVADCTLTMTARNALIVIVTLILKYVVE